MSQFVIAAPFCAVVLTGIFRKNTIGVISIAMLLLHTPWLLKCQQRPVLAEKNIFNTSRFELYFNHQSRRNHLERYRNSWEYIRLKGYENIGMITNPFSWEYVFWAMKYEDKADTRFENVAVRNISGELPYPGQEFVPDAVLSLVRQPEEILVIDEIEYKKAWSEGSFSVFTPVQ